MVHCFTKRLSNDRDDENVVVNRLEKTSASPGCFSEIARKETLLRNGLNSCLIVGISVSLSFDMMRRFVMIQMIQVVPAVSMGEVLWRCGVSVLRY